jgi:GTP-binding protein
VKAALERAVAAQERSRARDLGEDGKAVDDVLKVAFDLRESWSRRISTGELNRWFADAVDANPPPAPSGRRIKLRYITQVKSSPPDFRVFGHARRSVAGQLPSLSAEFDATRT